MLIIIAKKIATGKKLGMLKPGTIYETVYRIKAFTTKVNNPRVKIFKGSVSIIKIGLTSKLKIASIMADNNAIHNESTFIQLLINVDSNISDIQFAIIDKKKFLTFYSSSFSTISLLLKAFLRVN